MTRKRKTPRRGLGDARGVAIKVGDRVRQATAEGIPQAWTTRGALYINAGRTGVVTGLGRTRVAVDFGRELRNGERVRDLVCADLLIVVNEPDGRDAVS